MPVQGDIRARIDCCASVRPSPPPSAQERIMTQSGLSGTLALGDEPQTLEISILPAYQDRKTFLHN